MRISPLSAFIYVYINIQIISNKFLLTQSIKYSELKRVNTVKFDYVQFFKCHFSFLNMRPVSNLSSPGCSPGFSTGLA